MEADRQPSVQEQGAAAPSKRQTAYAAWKAFRWLMSYVSRHKGWMIVGTLSAIAAAVIEIWTGSLIEQLTTQAEKGAGPIVLQIVYTVFVVILIGVPAKFFMSFGVERSSASAVQDIRNRLMRHIGKLPISYLEKQHSGDVLSRINNDLQLIQQFMIRDLAQWFYHPLLFIGCFAYLIYLQWELMLYSLLLFPVALLVSQWIGKQLERLTEEAQANMGRMNVNLQDTLGGMPIVKSYLLSGMLSRSYQALLQLTAQKKLAVKKREAWVNPLLSTLMISPIIFAVSYGSYLIYKGQLGAGELIAFLYLLNLCLEPLEHIPELITRTFEMAGALRRVSEIVEQPTETENGRSLPKASAAPIEFQNVTFGYEEKSPILRNVSFSVPEGKTIALVGASGGGKSTVFKLVCGFYPLPEDQGEIRVFGSLIHGADPEQLRSHFSVVTQDSYLFSGTIAENIGYGREVASMDEIIEAAKAAQAHSFIMQLPDGYQTYVGERGGFLSGGQRQRIAMARAFLKDASVLLLDEPTSALDPESENAVQEALGVLMKQRTTMVIAHRLSTVQNADEIWVMEQGSIVEKGTHEQLLKMKGLYAQSYYQEFTESAERREVAYT
ncbi:Putative multidrug export ATP-binding/permease protein [Paenibacillus polymyxa E681]|uniref:PmxC n=1 Tax=Paenibacillus polymyxa TaxID=1406 RepID=B9TTF5_PAEPO|nr:ABC transporter ATP-binding protein [Paenibacillus polymyxa]ACA97578.1 PmxC [Paenibacillus polymyxa]ADM71966.1 ABC transporter ATP-binding protein [Paenibacillus polymyxa E681]QNV59001.1 Putative multidrug export ATP-binding/permease protein [Paenibacillus polymyxa E681]QNV63829.1 Putative multidrug export ATP-binding/permease protein [Paenibacillus polymyxa E681]